MFDLFRSREKSVRILLGGLLVVVAISMLTYLIPNYDTGAGGADTVVAEVNGDPITSQEIRKVIENQTRGKQLPPELIPTFVPQIVDQMVTERALAYQAQRLGYQVTDAQLADAIKGYIPQLFPDGKFVGRDVYAGFLQQQGMNIQDFEDNMRRQLLITRLRNIALEGTIVTPAEIEAEYRKKNEKVKIQYVRITSDKYKSEVQPSLEDMQAFYKINTSQYTTPEKRNLTVLLMDQDKVEKGLTPSDADLQRAYNQNQAQYHVPETVKVRHILLMTQGKPASEDGAIKVKAEDLLKQVKSGANFGELAKKYSEDPGSAAKGGEYDVQRNGQMVAEFENAAFTLKPGESDIVKTKYGYHVFQVMKHDQARLKPFDEVKAELAAQWKKQRASDLMQQASDRAQPELQKDPAHPEKVAAQFNMELKTFNGVEANRAIVDLGSNVDFDQAVAQLKKGEVSQPLALPPARLAIALCTDVIAPHVPPFDEVKDKIKDQIVKNRVEVAVQKHSQELLDKAKSNGGDLAAAAKSMGLEVKTSEEFTRTGNIEGVGPANYLSDAFGKPDGSVFGPVATPDATIVAKILSRGAPDMTKLQDQRVAIRDDLKRQKAQERNALFDAGLRDALVKDGKIKYHKQALDNLLSSYRAG